MSTKTEAERLIKYAKSLGIKVRMMHYVHFSNIMAEWIVDENNKTSIHVYQKPNASMVDLILDLLHELAHHRSWVKAGRKLRRNVARVLDKEDKDLTVNDKRLIYQEEKNDAKYQLEIARELDLKIPEHKIKVSVEQVNWIYRYNWKNDRHPTIKERRANLRKLREKYAC